MKTNVRSFFRSRALNQKTVWAAGAYDALSARLIEQAGFDAVMTSGFGVAASHLGLPDAELYSMSENLTVLRNVVHAVKIPVVADADTGYGNAINVMRTVREFEAAGSAAVILEDQVSPKRCPMCVSGVEVISIPEAVGKIRAAVEARNDPEMLIIARTDVDNVSEAIERGRAYVAAGADLVQPISLACKSMDDLRSLRQAVGVPLSLQILRWFEKDLTASDIESVAGMATFPIVSLMTVAAALQDNLAQIIKDKSTRNLPREVMHHEAFGNFIGFKEIEQLQLKYLPLPAQRTNVA